MRNISLYYPYGRCLDETALKKLVLIFDEVWFVDPLPKLSREDLIKANLRVPETMAHDWDIILHDYDVLTEAGVVKYFDPSTMIQKFGHLLADNLEKDIDDDVLWNHYIKDASGPIWETLKQKIPEEVFPLLKGSVAPGYLFKIRGQAQIAGLGHNYDDFLGEGLVWRDRVPRHMVPELDGRDGDGWFVRATPKEIFDLIFKRLFSDRGYDLPKHSNIVASVALPYVTGSALAVNEALLASEIVNATMVTDSEWHHRLLMRKFLRTSPEESGSENDLPSLTLSQRPQTELQIHRHVTYAVLEALIDTESLQRMTLQQCLKYKLASRESAQRLHEYLASLAIEIQSSAWDSALDTEIRHIIDGKIVPEVRKVRERSIEIRRKLFGSISLAGATTGIPSLAATVIPGMTSQLALLFGSSAVAGGVLAASLSELHSSFVERRSTRLNGLMYFLNLPGARRF